MISEINNLLTRQEKRIARLIAQDKSEKMIAHELFISEKTVHTHNKNIRKKLGVSTKVGIAIKYVQSLDDPKKFIIASLFLALQLFAIGITDNQERVFRKSARKTVKVRRYETA